MKTRIVTRGQGVPKDWIPIQTWVSPETKKLLDAWAIFEDRSIRYLVRKILIDAVAAWAASHKDGK